MAKLGSKRPAFGHPIAPKWTRSDKDGVGTAYSPTSTLWYTVAKGVVTEVYYPTIDVPQIRDLQYLATDGSTFFHDERRGFQNDHRPIADDALCFRITNTSHPVGAGHTYRIIKEVISSPAAPCVLIYTRIEVPPPLRSAFQLYALLAPHLDGTGWHNSGWVAETPYGKILVAQGTSTWLALGATVPFLKCSCGIVGSTDGWQDLNGSSLPGNQPYVLDWEFDHALDSNIALTGQLDLSRGDEFVLGLAFGDTLNSALVRLREALMVPFKPAAGHSPSGPTHLDIFLAQWKAAQQGLLKPGAGVTGDNDHLYRLSRNILMACEDKIYNGALIASPSIPWGEFSDDSNKGYHLVWTRDMCNSASGLLASGEKSTPLRALAFLSTVQLEDGGFYQNFLVNGKPAQRNLQLDEIAFPIMLAWRMHRDNALELFDPCPMVCRAACALILHGPMTQQKRWEENEGYSPSTLASTIAALVCAAGFARDHLDTAFERFLLEYADFLEAHLERWTVTTAGSIVPGVSQYYVRILPTSVKGDSRLVGPEGVPAIPRPDGDPNQATVIIGNRGGLPFPARNLIDGGFFELVRYGVRDPHDPVILESVKALDAIQANVKVDFSASSKVGPGWHRYNEDGYGNYADGRPFDGSGRGGTWPLLTGERGHYELAAGNNPLPYVRAMENFADATGLIPEQLWDLPDLPGSPMRLGYPSGAAMPLAWAHAEYLKLVRSVTDGKVFDCIPEVAARYLQRHAKSTLEIWNFYHQIDAVPSRSTVRVLLSLPFLLHWSTDDWAHVNDNEAVTPGSGPFYVDIPAPAQPGSIVFTFFWTDRQQWQGIDYRVKVT